MTGIVVDASVVAAWVFGDEKTALSIRLLREVRTKKIVVPGLWPYEVSNMLSIAERRGRLQAHEMGEVIQRLRTLRVELVQATLASAVEHIRTLARAHDLTVYDASYLAVAFHLSLPLATRDSALILAAGRVGVELIQT